MKKILQSKSLFNLKYYSVWNWSVQYSQLHNFFYYKFKSSESPLPHPEQQMNELFILKDKLFYASASLVGINFSELGSVDNFKADYPYTVS